MRGAFLMGEVPPYLQRLLGLVSTLRAAVQGYLAHKKISTARTPKDPRHMLAVGSQGGAYSYGRGTLVGL